MSLKGIWRDGKWMVDEPLAFSSALSSAVLAEIPFTLLACKSRTLFIFNEIKVLLPFADLCSSPPFQAHSLCFLLQLLCRRLDFAFIEWIFIFMFYQTTIAKLLRNTLFHSLRAKRESKANRWEKNFIRRPVFLDRVLVFFQFVRSFFRVLKIPYSLRRDTFIPRIRETIVKVTERMLVLLHWRDSSCNLLGVIVKLLNELSKFL